MKRVVVSVAVVLLSLAAWVPAAAAGGPQASAMKQPEATKQAQVQIVGTDHSPVVVALDELQRSELKKQRDEDEARRLEERKEDQQERLDERQEKSSSDNKLVWLTGILAAISAIQAIVFLMQWAAFRATVAEMENGTKATESLANITRDHVNATNVLAAQAESQANAARALSFQAHEQAKATTELAEAAKLQAMAAVNAERAYLFCEFNADVRLTNTIAGPQRDFPLGLTIRNSGKTPAELERVRAYIVNASEPPADFDEEAAVEVNLRTGAGIAQSTYMALNTKLVVSHQMVKDLANKNEWYYAVVSVEYRDIFRLELRTTTYCALFTHTTRGTEPHAVMGYVQDAQVNRRT